ncbi:MAG: phosphopantetheine-binding protein [Desulfobulbaceae bacterium]
MEELKKELKEMLVRDLKLQDVDPEDIGDDDPLFEEGLGLDSLDAVELVVLINKHYDIQIKDMEEGKIAFASVTALADFITSRRGG